MDEFEQRELPVAPAARKLIDWRCKKCNGAGRVPELFDGSAKPMVDAIERGHERKANGCHARYGVTQVLVAYRGKSIDVPTFQTFYQGDGR